jgi:hypothetical protein
MSPRKKRKRKSSLVQKITKHRSVKGDPLSDNLDMADGVSEVELDSVEHAGGNVILDYLPTQTPEDQAPTWVTKVFERLDIID